MSSKEQEFWKACMNGNLEKVKELSNQIDINWGDSDGWTGFFVACLSGNKEIVEYLISHPKINVNNENNDGRTPLWRACWYGKKEIVKILLKDERVNVNKEDNDGWTPLWRACANGKEEIVKILFASGREIDTTKKTNANETTAAEIARRFQYEQIAKLVEEYAKNPMEIILRLRKEMSKYLLIVSNLFNKIFLQKLN